MNPGRSAFDLVIFDCDGVLVDSEPIAARVLAEAVSEIGFALTTEEAIARFTGIRLRTVFERIEAQWQRRLPEDFLETLQQRDFAAFSADLRPIKGVRDALDAVRERGLRLCVASSGTPAKIRFTLGLTGLLPFFEPHLFSATACERGKPAPDVFLYAARGMGVAPDRCLVIEDAEAGVEGARAAGMRVFGFTGGGHCTAATAARLLAAGAERTFSAMDQFVTLLEAQTAGYPAAGVPAG